jgi:3',5'-cyclic-AMP phosphodiesterase
MKSQNISRREFIAGTLLSGAALTLGARAFGAATTSDRWILMADTHICQDRSREEHGIKPVETLAEARSGILALEPRPAGVIIAGDCAYLHGKAGDYAVLKEDLAPFDKAGIPVHMAMGNHDNRERFWEAFPESRKRVAKPDIEKHAYVVEGRHADWFVLDSNRETDFTPGEMGKPQLAWLAKELDKRPDKPALLVAHHYPKVSENDNGLLDIDALWEVIQGRNRVKAYLFGHSHTWSHKERDGVHLINVPAMGWLFDEAQPRAWVEAALRPDGMSLDLHCLNDVVPKGGNSHDLRWRV